jgi:hypothetical protein
MDARRASGIRRALIMRSPLPRTAFFLLASPERFYLWRRNAPEESAPDAEIVATDELASYARRLGRPIRELGGQSFELLILSWLYDLVGRASKPTAPSNDPFARTGLYEAVRNGRVVMEPQG